MAQRGTGEDRNPPSELPPQAAGGLGANQAESGNIIKFCFVVGEISLSLISPSSNLQAVNVSRPQSNQIQAVSQHGEYTQPTAAPGSSYLMAAQLLSLQTGLSSPALPGAGRHLVPNPSVSLMVKQML